MVHPWIVSTCFLYFILCNHLVCALHPNERLNLLGDSVFFIGEDVDCTVDKPEDSYVIRQYKGRGEGLVLDLMRSLIFHAIEKPNQV
jgi:hypothetical protein